MIFKAFISGKTVSQFLDGEDVAVVWHFVYVFTHKLNTERGIMEKKENACKRMLVLTLHFGRLMPGTFLNESYLYH